METSRVIAHLTRRGFIAQYLTPEQAVQYVLDHIAPEQPVGIGGSMTIRQLELDRRLSERGNPVYWHWLAAPEQRPQVLRKARDAGAYLCSVNALLEDGRMFNIDGNGNRVAASFFGPRQVFLIAGINKLVAGGREEAIARIKREACPANARRLGLDTPCARTGSCTPQGECFCEDRMCKTTVELSYCSPGHEVHVLLVDRPLGY